MVAGPIRSVAHRIVLISRRDTVRVTTAASNLLGTNAIARRARSSRSGILNHFVFDYRTYSWLHYFGFCACSSTICDCNWARGEVLKRVIDHVVCAEAGYEIHLGRATDTGDHCSQRLGDLDGEGPDATRRADD
jgi:hypothetical protein